MEISVKSPSKTKAYAANLLRFIQVAEELGVDFSFEHSIYPIHGWSVALDGIVMVDDNTEETIYSPTPEDALELALPIIDTVIAATAR